MAATHTRRTIEASAQKEIQSSSNHTFYWGSVDVGSSPTQVLQLTVTGVGFGASPVSTTLTCQTNQDEVFLYPDQFSVQVNGVTDSILYCQIRRIDADAGWGQDLQLNYFAVVS